MTDASGVGGDDAGDDRGDDLEDASGSVPSGGDGRVDGTTVDELDDESGSATDPGAPLSGIADRLARRDADGDRSPSDAPDFDDLFEREEVGEIDGERVWQQLEDDGLVDELTTPDRDVREIPKRAFCHQCPHFEAPPAVGCGNPGTTILEMPSMDTFRVADCPVVLEEAALEGKSTSNGR